MKEGRFRDNGDGTVTDTSTGLMWKKLRSLVPLPRDDSSFKAARQYCESLLFAGFQDWRLPTLQELIMLERAFKKRKYAPFRWEPGLYWYADEYPFTGNLDFPNGKVMGDLFGFAYETTPKRVRCRVLGGFLGYVRPVRKERQDSNDDAG